MSTEKDETYTVVVKGKPLASIKADLIHAFLSVSLYLKIFYVYMNNILCQVSDLQHSVTTPMSFRLEYKRGSTAPAMFQRQVCRTCNAISVSSSAFSFIAAFASGANAS